MPHNRVKPDGWVEDDTLLPEEATQLDINIADSAKLSSGTNVFNSNNTLNGTTAVNGPLNVGAVPVVMTGGTVSLTGSGIALTNTDITLATNSDIIVDDTGKITTGINSIVTLPKPTLRFNASTTREFYKNATSDNAYLNGGAGWVSTTTGDGAGSISQGFISPSVPVCYVELPELQRLPGATLTSITCYYTLNSGHVGPAANPIKFSLIRNVRPPLNGNASQITLASVTAAPTAYGIIKVVSIPCNITIDNLFSTYFIQVEGETGTNAMTANTVQGFLVFVNNVTNLDLTR